MPMLRSEPLAKDTRVLAQVSNKRVLPAIKAATQNAAVSGKSRSSGVSIPNAWIIGCALGCAKTLFGAVNTAKKGNVAPMLMISAIDEISIRNTRAVTWSLRR